MNDKARRIIASVISFFIYLAGSVLLLSSLYSDNGKFFLTVVCSLPLACILYCGIYSYVLTAKSGETVHPAQIMCVFILPYAVLGILFFITSLIIDEEYNFDIMFYLIFFVTIASVSFASARLTTAIIERKRYNIRVSEIKSGERNSQ